MIVTSARTAGCGNYCTRRDAICPPLAAESPRTKTRVQFQAGEYGSRDRHTIKAERRPVLEPVHVVEAREPHEAKDAEHEDARAGAEVAAVDRDEDCTTRNSEVGDCEPRDCAVGAATFARPRRARIRQRLRSSATSLAAARWSSMMWAHGIVYGGHLV